MATERPRGARTGLFTERPVTKLTVTFDNGPTPGVTDKVLDALRSRGLKSTFFLVGDKLATAEARDLVSRAHEEGHWIGNHTMHHGPPLGEWTDAQSACDEIAGAQEKIVAFEHRRRFFRPNGRGLVGPHLLSSAALEYLVHHRFTVVLWSIYVRDSKIPEGWAARGLAQIGRRDWDVLVVHDVGSSSMDALPRFLDTVLDQGIMVEQDFPADLVPLEQGALTPSASAILSSSTTSMDRTRGSALRQGREDATSASRSLDG